MPGSAKKWALILIFLLVAPVLLLVAQFVVPGFSAQSALAAYFLLFGVINLVMNLDGFRQGFTAKVTWEYFFTRNTIPGLKVVNRAEHPYLFWLHFSLQVLLGIVFIMIGYILLHPVSQTFLDSFR